MINHHQQTSNCPLYFSDNIPNTKCSFWWHFNQLTASKTETIPLGSTDVYGVQRVKGDIDKLKALRSLSQAYTGGCVVWSGWKEEGPLMSSLPRWTWMDLEVHSGAGWAGPGSGTINGLWQRKWYNFGTKAGPQYFRVGGQQTRYTIWLSTLKTCEALVST